MSGEKATLTNTGTIDIKGQESTGMFAKSSSKMINKGTINLIASTSADKPNIGMFTEDENTEIENTVDAIPFLLTNFLYIASIYVMSRKK